MEGESNTGDLSQSSLTSSDSQAQISDNGSQSQESSGFNWNDIGIDPSIDKRFNSMWKSPSDLFKWTHDLEKSTEKNNQSLNQYKKQVEELNSIRAEYDQIKNYIQMLAKDPIHGQQLMQILSSFDENIKQQKYGANVPDELIQRLEYLENKDKEQAENQKLEQETKEWRSTFSEMEKWSSKYDVDFGQETQQQFVDFLFQYQEKLGRNVTPIEAKALFYEIATPQLFEKSKMLGQQTAVKNLKNNNLSASMGGNKNNIKIEPKTDANKMSFSEYFNSKGR